MTSIVDTFNRADGALGTTSDGLATWTADTGGWAVATNQAQQTTLTDNSICHIDCGQADGTLQVTVATLALNNHAGLMFRRTDNSNFWAARIRSGGGASGSGLVKVVAGIPNGVGTFAASVNGDVLSVVLTGASITVKVNGSTVLTASDSFSQASTQHGMYVDAISSPRLDSWSFTDPVATPYRRPRIIVATRLALVRASVR